jgi:hypothetical protein
MTAPDKIPSVRLASSSPAQRVRLIQLARLAPGPRGGSRETTGRTVTPLIEARFGTYMSGDRALTVTDGLTPVAAAEGGGRGSAPQEHAVICSASTARAPGRSSSKAGASTRSPRRRWPATATPPWGSSSSFTS